MTEPDHPHEVYCSASRRIPIGGDACSCRAGREIKQLRKQVSVARAAMETAMQRFNLMSGVGLVNGACPKVGREELRDALKSCTLLSS